MKKINHSRKDKTGQESKNLLSRKSGQEEMVGFGLIIILVAVIFIVFLAFYIRKPPEITQDYKAGSFIQAVLQYTTMCEEANMENLSVQELIFKCQSGNRCAYRNMDPCQILDNTLKSLIRESWDVDSNSPIKGYSFVINVSEDRGETEQTLVKIDSGVVTNNYIGSIQDFGKSGEDFAVLFHIYN